MSKSVGLVALVGIGIGVLTLAGQGMLDANWNRLANSGAVWVTGAFFVGAVMGTMRMAAVAGLVTLLLAVVSYYLATLWFAGVGISSGGTAIWVGTALVGGPIFGGAGWWWRWGSGRQRVVGAATLGAVYVAEGAFTLLRIPALSAVGWVEVVVGLAFVVVLLHSRREVPLGLAALVPLAAVGLVGYLLIDLAFTLG